MGNYEKALMYARESLKINSTLMDFNGDNNISALTAAVPIKRFNSETIFYTEMSGFLVVPTFSRARTDTVLISSYNSSDLRRTGFFNNLGVYQQFKGSYSGSTSTFFSGLATDELYLISAESNAFLGNLDAAMSEVNTLLRKRWDKSKIFIPVTGTSRSELLAKIRQERRKELLMRGLRWIDIKRYNREGENIVLKRKIGNTIVSLEPNASYYAIPLPEDIVRQGLPQN